MQIDQFAAWEAPIILCARTTLGTINHTLLSLEALRARALPVLGVAFIGDGDPAVEATIATFGQVRRLGRLPHLPKLDPTLLRLEFASAFDIADFQSVRRRR